MIFLNPLDQIRFWPDALKKKGKKIADVLFSNTFNPAGYIISLH